MEQTSLFILYFLVFIATFYFISKKRKIELSFSKLSFAFIAKLAAGCFYGFIFLKIYKGDDTWKLHQAGLAEYEQLIKTPFHFFASLFQHGYQENQTLSFFTSHHSYWKDLPDNILIKLLAIFNLFSQGSYYINVIFFNFLVLWGHYFLYKLFLPLYEKNKQLLFCIVFFFPPLLFWESGIRKDGIMFLTLMGFLYHFSILIQTSKKKNIFYAILFLVGLFIFRNFVALVTVAVALFWMLFNLFPRKTILIFLGGLAIIVSLFFATSFLTPDLNLPLQMANRQERFQNLTGGSQLPLPQLTADFKSYISILPTAINHAFIRPYPNEIKNPFYLLAFAETVCLLTILVVLLFYNRIFFTKIIQSPLLFSLLLLAVFNYILIGYMVPFLGAIIRYKAIYEIILFLILLKGVKHLKL